MRRALGDRLDHGFDIEPGLAREMNAFREALHHARNANLVDHLGELSRARRSEQLAHARIGGDHFLGASIRFGIAAAHHGEHAVLRAGFAARHRRVDEIEAAFLCLRVEFARDLGRRRGVIDEHRALPYLGERSARDRAHIVVVADAHHDDVLALDGVLRRLPGAPAEFLGPLFCLRGGAVIDRHLVAALVLQVSGHRVAHHAQA